MAPNNDRRFTAPGKEADPSPKPITATFLIEKRTKGIPVNCNNEVDVPSPVMLVFATGINDVVVVVVMDNVTSVLLHIDAQDERADKLIAPP